ncbi:MAG TPA: hypothetical protein VIU64_11550, partial [Polyangia bacterium]
MTRAADLGGGGDPAPGELGDALARVDAASPLVLVGRVTEVTGLVVRAAIPATRVGELVWIETGRAAGGEPVRAAPAPIRVQAEVVGFRGDEVVLMPLGEAVGIGPDAQVRATGRPFTVRVGAGLLGRVLDGLGDPMDGGGPLAASSGQNDAREEWPVD